MDRRLDGRGSALYQGGLTVTTTLEPSLQQIATDVLRDGLEAYDRRHGYRGAAWTIDDPEGTDWAGQLSDPGTRPVWIPPPLGTRRGVGSGRPGGPCRAGGAAPSWT